MSTHTIRATLLCDGPSDSVLERILSQLWRERIDGIALDITFADTRRMESKRGVFSERIHETLQKYPCEVLFLHRDAENQSAEDRKQQMESALGEVSPSAMDGIFPVYVIPVRMTEAWLLIDEQAIRLAAEFPQGTHDIGMPALKTLESLPDPKTTLHGLIVEASLRTGRHRARLVKKKAQKVQEVASYIQDFSPLRQLSAFQALEAQIENLARELQRRN